ncbi:type I secretion C-terminal target domain-containing protein, partial [Pseudomonas sp. SA3-5]
GSNDIPEINVDPGNGGTNDLVYEAGLANGSDAASNSEFASGSFSLSDADGLDDLQSVTINGTTVVIGSLVGASFAGSNGTLTITAYNSLTGVGSYSYELTSPTIDVDGVVESDTFSLTTSDGTASSLPASIVIEIVDDVPQPFAPATALLVDQVPTSHMVTTNLNFANAAGADGVGTVVFSNFTEGDIATDAYGQTLFLNGVELHLYYGADETELVLKTLDDQVGLVIDIDPSSDTYTLTSYGVISNGAIEVTTTNLSGVGAGNVNFKGLIDIGGTVQDALISSTSGSINSDIDDIGIGSQWISTAENVRFDFINNLATGGANGTGFVYTDHNTVFGFRQKLYVQGGKTNTANLIVTAIIANNDYVFGNADGGETQVNLSTTDIKVFNGSGVDVTGSVTLVDNGNSITIQGMQDSWTYQISSDTGFSAVYVEGAADTDEFSLGFFTYTQTAAGEPIDLNFDITATDGDGDSVTSAINSTLYPLASSVEGDDSANVINGTSGVDHLFGYGGDDTLSGLLGNDVLSGGDGEDTLIGGLGNDLMSGGAGKDTFVWNSGDTGIDHITDFTVDTSGVNSDVLDLSQLLVGETDSGNVLDAYLNFNFAATSTTIDVSATAGGPVVQQIVLEGVDLSSGAYYGSSDAATVIDGMLGDNALKVDTV